VLWVVLMGVYMFIRSFKHMMHTCDPCYLMVRLFCFICVWAI
jgi:hypothetical protein